MAAIAALSMAMPLASSPVNHKRSLNSVTFFNPMKLRARATAPSIPNGKCLVRASLKEQAVTGLTAIALTAAMVIPDVAEAAQPGLSPSLKNFLLSIVSGGVVLGVLVGAVIGVANFDPVKRT